MRVCLIGLLLTGVAVAEDAEWNQFRGPNGDGRADSANLPVTFGESENVKWKTPIHGKGWSSPVVSDGRIWMATATEDGKKMYGVCVSADDGQVLHDKLIFENVEPRFCHPTNSYASPTPIVESGRVYFSFGSYGTACLDAKTAEVLWTRRDLECDHFRGPASSPVLFEDVLIVPYDGFDKQYVVGFDKRTGKTKWRTPREIDYGTDNGDRKKAYATAATITVDGKPQVVIPSAGATVAYQPLTGKEIWRVNHGGMNAAARPVFGDGLVYVTAGDGGKSMVAIRPTGQGDVTDTHIAWTLGKTVPKRSSQLLIDDRIFMVNDAGVASCLHAKTGKVIWQKRLEGDFWASPLYANGRIYLSSKEGRMPVIAAADSFKLLADNRLETGINASPAVIDDDLIVRSWKHLYRIGK